MRLVTALTAALLFAGGPSVAAGVLDRIEDTGTVRFGFREDAAPLSYRGADGQPAGYSVLICKAVAEHLAQQLGTPPLTIDWQPVTTTDRFDAVAGGRIDLLCGAASITLTRREIVDFSLPTFVDGAAVLLPKDADPNFDALEDRKIGVRAGTSTEQTLRNTLAAKSMPAEVVTFDSHGAGLAALEERHDRRLLRRPVDPLRPVLSKATSPSSWWSRRTP